MLLHDRQATPGSSLGYQELLSPLQPLASCARAPDVPQEGPTSHPAGASGGGWLPRQALWPYVHVPFPESQEGLAAAGEGGVLVEKLGLA